MHKTTIIIRIIFIAVAGLWAPPLHASAIGDGQQHFFRGEYTQALENFREALEKRPKNPMIHFFIGQTYFKMEQFERAREALTKSIELKSDYTIARLFLARTCFRLGNIPCAEKHYGWLLDKKPEELESTDRSVISQIGIGTGKAVGVTAMSSAATDRIPPKIVITSPQLNRGISKVTGEDGDVGRKTVVVAGNAIDDSGVLEVAVNGQAARLLPSGFFKATVLVSEGMNNIVVSATDKFGNSSARSFVIQKLRPDSEKALKAAVEADSDSNLKGEYHALLIAVDEYDNPGVSDLDKPISDAQELMEILTREYTFLPENIRFLKNPDRSQIMGALLDISRTLDQEDNLLIFFAGHGYWDEQLGIGYWLARDAGREDRSAWLSNSTIRDFISGISAKHTLLVADACFSGGIFKTRKAFGDVSLAIQELYKLPSRKAMTSGTLTEVPDRSVFVQYLIRRLHNNPERYLTSQQLFASFRQAVINNSELRQVPQYGTIHGSGDEGGDFIFVRK